VSCSGTHWCLTVASNPDISHQRHLSYRLRHHHPFLILFFIYYIVVKHAFSDADVEMVCLQEQGWETLAWSAALFNSCHSKFRIDVIGIDNFWINRVLPFSFVPYTSLYITHNWKETHEIHPTILQTTCVSNNLTIQYSVKGFMMTQVKLWLALITKTLSGKMRHWTISLLKNIFPRVP